MIKRGNTLIELREALLQISEIREQVARTEVFRGYRAVPVAFSGLVALAAATAQTIWITEPTKDISTYLFLWVGAALLSLLATGVEMVLHCRHTGSALDRAKALLAVGQFAPSVVVGGVLTAVLVMYAWDTVWMLPGLWAMCFSLGVFASHRLLPKAIFWVAVYYLIAGALCLIFAQGKSALSPWAMGVPFGVGQFATAAILYWTLERRDVEEQQE